MSYPIGMEHHPEYDAETLAEAEAIKADSVRLNAAKRAAKIMTKRQEERAKDLNAVADIKSKKSNGNNDNPSNQDKKADGHEPASFTGIKTGKRYTVKTII